MLLLTFRVKYIMLFRISAYGGMEMRGVMKRAVSVFLDNWIKDMDRKPLVVRGARQVGKTWLIRDLAQRHNCQAG